MRISCLAVKKNNKFENVDENLDTDKGNFVWERNGGWVFISEESSDFAKLGGIVSLGKNLKMKVGQN